MLKGINDFNSNMIVTGQESCLFCEILQNWNNWGKSGFGMP